MNSTPKAQVAILFPHAIYPVRSGIQLRYAQLVENLVALNYDVIVISFYDSPLNWTTQGRNILLDKGARLFIMESGFSCQSTLEESDQFHRLLQLMRPDILINSYITYHHMVQAVRYMDILTVIDVNDLISKIIKDRNTININRDGAEFNENDEIDIIKSYDRAFCISKSDADRLKLAYLPMLPNVLTDQNNYRDHPIFVAHANEFNIEAHNFLTEHLHLLETPITVIGSLCDHVKRITGLNYMGEVDDLGPHYTNSSFSICPVRYGSGQKVKVLEAMANGLTVVAFANQVNEPYIDNYYNSFIINSTQDMISYINHLNRYATVRAEMGRRAKEAALSYFNPALYKKILQQALE